MDHSSMNRFIEENGEAAEYCPLCKKWVKTSKMRCGSLFGTKICFTCYRKISSYMESITETGLKWIQEKIGNDKITIKIKLEKLKSC